MLDNEQVKNRISSFAGERIYYLICAHTEIATPIELVSYNGYAFYKWTAFDRQENIGITLLYNVATDNLQILIDKNGEFEIYKEDANEYSPFNE